MEKAQCFINNRHTLKNLGIYQNNKIMTASCISFGCRGFDDERIINYEWP